jgi:hypothetical protein
LNGLTHGLSLDSGQAFSKKGIIMTRTGILSMLAIGAWVLAVSTAPALATNGYQPYQSSSSFVGGGDETFGFGTHYSITCVSGYRGSQPTAQPTVTELPSYEKCEPSSGASVTYAGQHCGYELLQPTLIGSSRYEANMLIVNHSGTCEMYFSITGTTCKLSIEAQKPELEFLEAENLAAGAMLVVFGLQDIAYDKTGTGCPAHLGNGADGTYTGEEFVELLEIY